LKTAFAVKTPESRTVAHRVFSLLFSGEPEVFPGGKFSIAFTRISSKLHLSATIENSTK
jgi:hypothetical protein